MSCSILDIADTKTVDLTFFAYRYFCSLFDNTQHRKRPVTLHTVKIEEIQTSKLEDN
jgi:hypothetical protein